MDAKTYLTNHGLTEEFVTKKLGWKLKEDRIDIPIYGMNGKRSYTRSRMFTGDNKFLTEKGAKMNLLYRISQAIAFPEIVFCEGEPDCAKLWQEGIPAVTFPSGVKSLSTSTSPEAQKRILSIIEPLANKTIYLCLDTDEAGQSSVFPLAKQLKQINCQVHIVSLPPAHKDVSDYFVAGNKVETFKVLMESSPTYESLAISRLSSQYPILDNATFTETTYPPTKWLIDKLIRVGGISFLVGESGTGKTIASLSITKALSEGTPWLGKYPASQSRILLLDKENTPADIQKLFKTMGIRNPNVFNFFSEDDYNLIDETGKPTEVSEYLSLYIQQNNINVVILDSAIDFLVGDENSSTDVAANINAWRDIFSLASILTIHHDSKQNPQVKKKSADRMRGSGVWLSSAQSVLSFSVLSQEHPERLMVEHAKVRGGRKSKPFEIEMIIRPDPTKEGETIVDGYKYVRELKETKLISDKAKEGIVKFLTDHLETVFTAKELHEELQGDGLIRKNIDFALTDLSESGDIERLEHCGENNKAYGYKMCVSNVLENMES